jgi:uncharacterized protein
MSSIRSKLSKKLLEPVSGQIRLKHYVYSTEETYCQWISRYILFQNNNPLDNTSVAKNETRAPIADRPARIEPSRPWPSTMRLSTLARPAALILATGLALSLGACGNLRPPTTLANMPRSLTVAGQGTIDIPQTLAQVQLGVEVQGETSVETQTDVAKRSTAIVALLQKNKAVKKLTTNGATLNPTYKNKDGQNTIAGYRGTNIVRFQIDPAAIGTLLDDVVKAGATRVDGVTLVASDEAIEKAQDEAIERATQQAHRQAKAALGALSLASQEVVSIQINGAVPNPMANGMMQMNLMAEAQSAAIPVSAAPIVAGEQRIQASVSLQVRY